MVIDDILIKVKISAEEAKETLIKITENVQRLKELGENGSLNINVNTTDKAAGANAANGLAVQSVTAYESSDLLEKLKAKAAEAEMQTADSYAVQLAAEEKFLSESLAKKVMYAATDLELAQTGHNSIVKLILSFYDAYAAAGNKIGSGYADAFNIKMDTVKARIDMLKSELAMLGAGGGSGSGISAGGSGGGSSTAQGAAVNIYQTFTGQTATPAEIAKQTTAAVESVLKNG